MNEDLRSHVTRVGFDLSLGKTHIAALVYIDQVHRHKSHFTLSLYKQPFNYFATGGRGLLERGLVTWESKSKKADLKGEATAFRANWKITPAGKLVIGLLKEAGIYQEFADVLVPSREKSA